MTASRVPELTATIPTAAQVRDLVERMLRASGAGDRYRPERVSSASTGTDH